MSIRKGLVLEIDGQDAIILSDCGEFTRVPIGRRNLEVGMEIILPSKRKKWSAYGRRVSGWLAGAAAAVVFFAISPLMSLVQPASGQVVAYVNMDITPNIEMAIDGNQRVVAAEPYNNDGRRVLSEVDVVGKKMDAAAALITEQAIKDGYLNKQAKNSVMIALTPAQGQKVAGAWETHLQDSVKEVLANEHQVAVVDTMVGSQELRLSAMKQGLSVGKFMVLLAANEKNLPITVAEVKKKPIGELILAKGANPAELVPADHTTKDWDAMAAKFDSKMEDGRNGTDSGSTISGPVMVAEKPAVKPATNQGTDNYTDKDPVGVVSIAAFNPGKPTRKPAKPDENGSAAKPTDSGITTKPGDPVTTAKPGDEATASGSPAGTSNPTEPNNQSNGTANQTDNTTAATVYAPAATEKLAPANP